MSSGLQVWLLNACADENMMVVCVLLEQPLDALQHSFIDNQNDVSILQSTRPLICRGLPRSLRRSFKPEIIVESRQLLVLQASG